MSKNEKSARSREPVRKHEVKIDPRRTGLTYTIDFTEFLGGANLPGFWRTLHVRSRSEDQWPVEIERRFGADMLDARFPVSAKLIEA
jgi:hypothetical protein